MPLKQDVPPSAIPFPQAPLESLHLDLADEIAGVRSQLSPGTGTARKSLVRYPDLHVTLIAMKAQARIEEHQNAGRISVQTLRGHIRMQAAGKLFELPEGHVLVLDRAVRHDVEAVEDSVFLLTSVPPR